MRIEFLGDTDIAIAAGGLLPKATPFHVYYRSMFNSSFGTHACFAYHENGDSVHLVNSYGFSLFDNLNDFIDVRIRDFNEQTGPGEDVPRETQVMMNLGLPKVAKFKHPLVISSRFLLSTIAAKILREKGVDGLEAEVKKHVDGLPETAKDGKTPFNTHTIHFLAQPRNRLMALRMILEAFNSTERAYDTSLEEDQALIGTSVWRPLTETMKAAILFRTATKLLLRNVLKSLDHQVKQLLYQIASGTVKNLKDSEEEPYHQASSLATILV